MCFLTLHKKFNLAPPGGGGGGDQTAISCHLAKYSTTCKNYLVFVNLRFSFNSLIRVRTSFNLSLLPTFPWLVLTTISQSMFATKASKTETKLCLNNATILNLSCLLVRKPNSSRLTKLTTWRAALNVRLKRKYKIKNLVSLLMNGKQACATGYSTLYFCFIDYSNHLNTGRVWYLNGPNMSCFRMVKVVEISYLSILSSRNHHAFLMRVFKIIKKTEGPHNYNLDYLQLQ